MSICEFLVRDCPSASVGAIASVTDSTVKDLFSRVKAKLINVSSNVDVAAIALVVTSEVSYVVAEIQATFESC